MRTAMALILLTALATPLPGSAQAERRGANAAAAEVESQKKSLLGIEVEDQPTFIKSDSLTLRAEDKVFVYTGNVEVKQGDMTMTSDILEGTYNDKNEVIQLIAKDNVEILKGEDMRATSQYALYERETETVTLTENPELQRGLSVLTADSITIFLAEDRSTAEGRVRVKLVKEGEEEEDMERRRKRDRKR